MISGRSPIGCSTAVAENQPLTEQNRMHIPSLLGELARYLESQIPGAPSCQQPTTPPSAPPATLISRLYQRQSALNPSAVAWIERQPGTGNRSTGRPVESLADLPALPVTAFKQLELTTVPPADRVATFHSSGTTGHQPSRHIHSPETLWIYQLAAEAWFKRRVLGDFPWAWTSREPAPSDRPCMLSLTPRPTDALHSSLAYMIGMLINRLGADPSTFHGRTSAEGWELDCDSARAALRQSAHRDHGRPVIIFGTAFNFVHLLDAMEAAGETMTLPPGSRVMETGGYKGRSRTIPKAELHQAIADRLGLPLELVITEYGMSELSSQAYDTDRSVSLPGSTPLTTTTARTARPTTAGRRLQFPPWCHATVISPETRRECALGEPGLLRIADLANVASVLAIQTEDLAVAHGDGIELLGRAAAAEPRGCSLLPDAAESNRPANVVQKGSN